MAKIIQFPNCAVPRKSSVMPADMPKIDARQRSALGFWGGLVLGVWMITVLLWGILRWIVAMDVLWQFGRMVYYWDDPGVYAGWQFLGHFAVLSALTYYVGVYRPRGAPDSSSAGLAAKKA